MWIGQIITIIYQLIQGGSLAKNIPGADSISGSVPRLSRSVPETAVWTGSNWFHAFEWKKLKKKIIFEFVFVLVIFRLTIWNHWWSVLNEKRAEPEIFPLKLAKLIIDFITTYYLYSIPFYSAFRALLFIYNTFIMSTA